MAETQTSLSPSSRQKKSKNVNGILDRHRPGRPHRFGKTYQGRGDKDAGQTGGGAGRQPRAGGAEGPRGDENEGPLRPYLLSNDFSPFQNNMDEGEFDKEQPSYSPTRDVARGLLTLVRHVPLPFFPFPLVVVADLISSGIL